MECPHLTANVKINRDFLKSKKFDVTSGPVIVTTIKPLALQLGAANAAQSSNSTAGRTTATSLWRCSECMATKENWMCLNCGQISCGRYESQHAVLHSDTNADHNVVMSIMSCAVYCYKCDEFVTNDTPNKMLSELRLEWKEEDSASETSAAGLDESLSNKSLQETASTTSSSDSGWEEPLSLGGRRLRPRKRTISCDSNESSATNKKKQSLKKKFTIPVVGLRNLGNTCFMNSVLQSLSNIQEFSCYFNTLPSLEASRQKRVYQSRNLKENQHDGHVVEELRKILINLSHGGDGTKAISPECLFVVIWKVVPQFRGHRQHDAHEFLRYMLDRLHTELQNLPISPLQLMAAKHGNEPTTKTGPKPNTLGGLGSSFGSSGSIPEISSGGNFFKGRSSIVTNVFGGTLQSEVRCLICGMESKKHDPFLDLSLDIPERFFNDCDNENSKPTCHISDCLQSFTEVEELAETELYYCNSCKCKQKSTKRFRIRRLPNVLCLHIKRFRWNNFFRTKIDLRITFPISSLDMSQYVLNNGPETRRSSACNNIYDLAAVIVHHGNGSSCGHYTSFAINKGVWLHFNDHTVKEVRTADVAECKPYILFYIRRDTSNKTI